MKKNFFFLLGLLFLQHLAAQIPQGFNYQAVIRNSEGEPISNQTVSLKISLLDSDKNALYTENHSPTTSSLGTVSLVVGEGQYPSANLADLPWSQGGIKMRVEVDPTGGTDYTVIGTSPLQAVPYALYASQGTGSGVSGSGEAGKVAIWSSESSLSSLSSLNFDNNVEVVSPSIAEDDDPIFEVKNRDGKVVFGVYQTGVRIYVEDSHSKGRRSGFAIGGLSDQTKNDGVEYFRLTPDSVRFNINMPINEKGRRSGFAIGGLSDQTKNASVEYFTLAPDNVRFNINTSDESKGRRSGFAIGGLSDQTKVNEVDFFNLTPDSVRFNINMPSGSKGRRSGFAIGGLSDQTKEESSSFLFLTPDNYLIGQGAGKSITEGLHNSFLGYRAGESTTTGNRNIFIGEESGQGNTNGGDNIFLGRKAGFSGQSGNYNMFFGNESGFSINNGQHNIAMGWKAGHGLTNGEHNIFIGNQSGLNNAGDAFYGSYNIFVGYNSGQANIQGFKNIFFGYESGYSNTNGWGNIFFGENSGYENTEGTKNVFLGVSAGKKNETGNDNVYLGYRAAENKTVGNYNTFVGSSAGLNNLTGSNNVFIGFGAGASINGSNKLAIANTSSSAPLIYGEFDNKKIGINTQNPTASLNIVGAYTGDNPEGVYIDLHNNSGSTGLVSTNRSGIRFKNVAETTNSYHKAGIFFQRNATHGRGNFIFAINNSEDDANVTPDDIALVINRNKNVGIGLTNPLSPLQVRGVNTSTNGSSGVFIDVENFLSTSGTLSGIRFKNNTTTGSTSNYLGGMFFEKGAGFVGDLLLAASPNGNNITVADAGIRIKNTGHILMPKLRTVSSSDGLLPLFTTEDGEVVRLDETKSSPTKEIRMVDKDVAEVLKSLFGKEDIDLQDTNQLIPLVLKALLEQNKLIESLKYKDSQFEALKAEIESIKLIISNQK